MFFPAPPTLRQVVWTQVSSFDLQSNLKVTAVYLTLAPTVKSRISIYILKKVEQHVSQVIQCWLVNQVFYTDRRYQAAKMTLARTVENVRKPAKKG